MKVRMTALLLALILCGSLAACGGQSAEQDDTKKDDAAVETVKDEAEKEQDKAEDTTREEDKTDADKDAASGSQSSNTAAQSKPQSGSTSSPTGNATASKPQSSGSTSSGSTSSGSSSSGSTTSKPQQSTPAPEPVKPTASQASGYIGSSASALESALGSPSSKSYSPSCMGEGEDGVWTYSGFTVYTYRENGVETVEAVS